MNVFIDELSVKTSDRKSSFAKQNEYITIMVGALFLS